MVEKMKILFVEDVKADAELVWREIVKNKISFEKYLVDNRKDFLEGLSSFSPDIIISDYSLPMFDGMAALRIRNEKAPQTPFILVTGSINEEVAVECMKAGADDYILKENLSRLGPALNNAVNKIELIKEKNEAEVALHESEERFRVLYNEAVVGLYRTNLHGEIIQANTTLIKMLGFQSFEELKKRNLKEAGYGPSFWRRDFIDQVEKSGEVNGLEAVWIRKDDTEIFVRESTKAIYSPEGEILYFDGTVQDITDQKLADEKVKATQLILEGILNTIPVRVFWKDSNLVYLGCNKIFAQDAGFEYPKDIIGKNDCQLVWKDQAELYMADDKQVIESGIPKFNIEENQTTPEGNIITLLTSKIPLLNSNGKISGILGTYVDITKRKKAEEQLQQAYLFNESLLRTIPFGMDIVDENGNILFLSESFRRIFGEEAINRKCWDLYRDDKKQCRDCPLVKGIKTGETDTYESHGVLGGRIFDISHTGMIYQGKKAILEIFQDVTERKENEEQLIMAKDRAEESDRLKTAFLNNISHEIRTPMNAIVGFSALLAEPDVDAQKRQAYNELIMQSSDHLLSIISDMVEISNIEANLVKVTLSEVNINQNLQFIYKQYLPLAEEKSLTLSYDTFLPDSEANVLADITKLNQILSNLVNNALKFTEQGNIKIEYRRKNDFIEFCVSDTGVGILPEYHERIFDRFFQLQSSASRLNEGTGLGLSISKSYVELMGGEFSLSSEPGKGTKFFFTIPYRTQIREDKPVVEIPGNKDIFFPENKTILVAEDSDTNYKLITYFFHGTNTKILRAKNGKEAVEIALSEKDIDLILMDIRMPVMDGYSAVKRIRKENPFIPIIAQTAYDVDKNFAIGLGCNGFISKPFDKVHLLNSIKEFLNNGN
jgi:PAS domain S-box-containing protein